MILWVTLAIAVAGSGVYLLRLPQLQIRKIETVGLQVLTEAAINERVAVLLDGNYFLIVPKRSVLFIRTGTITQILQESFPRLESVTVSRKFPDTLIVSVVERELWGIFCSSGVEPSGQISAALEDTDLPHQEVGCAYIDKTGFAFERAPSSSGSLIKKIKIDEADLALASYAVEPDIMSDILRLSGRVEDRTKSPVVTYELFSKIPREVRMTVAEGFTLYLNRDGDIVNTLRVLKLVLEEEIKDRRSELEYIDARFGNKVFYKFRQ